MTQGGFEQGAAGEGSCPRPWSFLAASALGSAVSQPLIRPPTAPTLLRPQVSTIIKTRVSVNTKKENDPWGRQGQTVKGGGQEGSLGG